MSPRTGRPPSSNPLDVDIKVRIDKETKEKLAQYCQEHSITRTEAIRQGIYLLLQKKSS